MERNPYDTRAQVETWETALNRRLRTLLRTAPLTRIEASKALRSDDLTGHDLRALALRAIDHTIERMGFGTGVGYDELVDALAPLIRAVEPDATEGRVRTVADVVISGLLNERDRRVAFREPYTSFEGGRATQRALAFHLLREEEAPDGTIVIRASTEAINVYAGMLEIDVEDAQAAEEAILQSQIRRGKVSQAVTTARQARLRSIEYGQKLSGILETARRDIAQIAWVDAVLAMLEEAFAHLTERMRVEREILDAAERRLDRLFLSGGERHGDDWAAAANDAHEAPPNEAAQLVDLCDTLRDCLDRHLALHQRLISANQTYLTEQERQSFRNRPLSALPDLEGAVLRPALALPAELLDEAVDTLLRVHHAPRAPGLVYLPQLVGALLGPRRGVADPDIAIEAPDLHAVDAPERRFADADHRAVETLIRALPPAGKPLSELLEDARERGMSDRARHLLVLRALLAVDPATGDGVTHALGSRETFRDAEFLGDDLLLVPRNL